MNIKNKIIYISGKIKNNNQAEQEFEEAEQQIKKKGYNAINPLKITKTIRFMDQEQFMELDFALIKMADEVYVLENWRKSKGAVAEIKFAKAIGKKVKFQSKQWSLK